ncbi:type II secretion system protein GspI [Marinomonas agarivorans]|nr:type II secretion system protein GspI [Marinomonas agarivorans]
MLYKLLKTNKAFTLMEVLVALLILASVGVVLVQVTSQATGQASYLQRKMLAVWVAQDRVTQLTYLAMNNKTVNLGDEEVEQGHFAFRTQATLLQTVDGISTIEVAVYQPPTADESMYRLKGFLAAATKTPQAEP